MQILKLKGASGSWRFCLHTLNYEIFAIAFQGLQPLRWILTKSLLPRILQRWSGRYVHLIWQLPTLILSNRGYDLKEAIAMFLIFSKRLSEHKQTEGFPNFNYVILLYLISSWHDRWVLQFSELKQHFSFHLFYIVHLISHLWEG